MNKLAGQKVLGLRCLKTTFLRQNFSTSRIMASSLNEQFEQAKKTLNTLSDDPGNMAKLKIYGLFKQATVGKCNAPKPKMFDMVGKAKWDAWNALGDLNKEDAQKEYVSFVNELAGAKPEVAPKSVGGYETLLLTKEGRLATIVLNRPDKKNAISLKMYEEIIKVLSECGTDDQISITVMTGAGDYYCSGNDLGNVTAMGSGDLGDMAKQGGVILNKFVSSFIDFPKPLIGLVNGPAVGVAVTVLGLFDVVYASERATFQTPFSVLGQSPEGCSSYIFPKLMGSSRANEMLMFNKKLTAKEAVERGLVAEVFPDRTFKAETDARVKEMVKLPLKSLLYAKEVNRHLEKELLHKVNDKECDNLLERWMSEDFMNAVSAFFSRKSNL